MSTLSIVLAGLAGTALMTAFVYYIASVSQLRLQVVSILGTLVTGQTTAHHGLSHSLLASCSGMVLHYAIGVLFSFAFAGLCHLEVLSFDYCSALLFGFAAGLLAMAVWRATFALHPHPPSVPLPVYLPVIGLGHLIYATGMFAIFYIWNV